MCQINIDKYLLARYNLEFFKNELKINLPLEQSITDISQAPEGEKNFKKIVKYAEVTEINLERDKIYLCGFYTKNNFLAHCGIVIDKKILHINKNGAVMQSIGTLHVIVAPRHDLDFIIEEEYTDIKSNISVYDLVSELAQTPNITEKSITVIVDGKVVPFVDWKKYFLSEEKNHEIKFILEPEGTVVMVAFVFIAMVATFLYTMRMMHKLNSKTGTDSSGESRSIYDVNAQGNKIKLGDVIPEQFGLFKKFPDYLADAHAFYRNNEYYLDCTGNNKVLVQLHRSHKFRSHFASNRKIAG